MTSAIDDRLLDDALALGMRKCLRDARTLPSFPHVTRGGEWLVSEHGRWTAGFFIGMLWIAALEGEEEGAADLARSWTRRLAPRATDRSTHDMGFLFEPSFVRAFKITGEAEFRDGAVEAARSLATRFQPRGRYIPAWTPEEDPSYAGLAIVDTIMNIPILLWAANETKDPALRDVAMKTARTIREQHVRADGSTYHTVDHDPATGAVTVKGTHQGAHAESCWTRGQAWALQGFAKVGAMTGEPAFLDVAQQLADYFLLRLGDAVLPPWDFERDGPAEPRDSAAAAIAASGLLELGWATGNAVYATAARRIAVGLARTCIDFDHPETFGLLRNGAVDVPRNSGIGESIMYGDQYYMEALMKIRHPATWSRLGCVEG